MATETDTKLQNIDNQTQLLASNNLSNQGARAGNANPNQIAQNVNVRATCTNTQEGANVNVTATAKDGTILTSPMVTGAINLPGAQTGFGVGNGAASSQSATMNFNQNARLSVVTGAVSTSQGWETFAETAICTPAQGR
jgi:hypothetical protein